MNKILAPVLALTLSISSLFAGGSAGGPWANGAYYPGQLDGRYTAAVYNNTQARQSFGQSDQPTNSVNTATAVTTVNGITGTNFSSNTVTTSENFTTETPPPTFTNTTTTTISNGVTTTLITNTTEFGNPAGDVVSGLLGFGIRNGTPAVGAASNNPTAAGNTNGNASVSAIGLDPSLNYFLIYVNGDTFAGTTAATINPQSGGVAGALVNGAGRVNYRLFTNQAPNPNGTGVVNVGVSVINLPTASASGYFNAKVKSNKSPYTFKGAGQLSTTVTDAAGTRPQAGSTRVYAFNVDGIKSSENSASASTQTGRVAP